MNGKGKVFHSFFGANTSEGFQLFTDEYRPANEIENMILLDGAPGTGKSSVLLDIANQFTEEGYNICLQHNALDLECIDAVIISDLKICIADSTKFNQAVEFNPIVQTEKYNLDCFTEASAIKERRKQILDFVQQKKLHLNVATGYLASARKIEDNIKFLVNRCVEEEGVQELSQMIFKNVFHKVKENKKYAKVRDRFASSITAKSVSSYIDPILLESKNVVMLKGYPGSGKDTVLKHVISTAVDLGYNIDLYYNPIHPTQVELAVIPELDTAVVSTKKYIVYKDKKTIEYNFNEILNKVALLKIEDEIKVAQKLYDLSIDSAISNMKQAKLAQEALKQLYTPYVNYSEVNKQSLEIIQKIKNIIN